MIELLVHSAMTHELTPLNLQKTAAQLSHSILMTILQLVDFSLCVCMLFYVFIYIQIELNKEEK